ncbi:unnamed protein product, partial [Ectocarpus sp. 4 AP-2014]
MGLTTQRVSPRLPHPSCWVVSVLCPQVCTQFCRVLATWHTSLTSLPLYPIPSRIFHFPIPGSLHARVPFCVSHVYRNLCLSRRPPLRRTNTFLCLNTRTIRMQRTYFSRFPTIPNLLEHLLLPAPLSAVRTY